MKAQPLTLPIVISWLKVHLESYLPALALWVRCCEIARIPLLPIGLFVSGKRKKKPTACAIWTILRCHK